MNLLLTLAFWTALIEGAVALAAACEVSQGKWILPVKKQLLAVYRLIPVAAFLFIVMALELHKNWFFVLRNMAVFLFTWWFAGEFAKKNKYAVLYLLFFVLSQSLIAFDWIMPLEYPWVSTLLGGYFFVESFYAGIALAGLFCAFLRFRKQNETLPLYDVATMLFGFSLLWVGLFYAQFLVIWYGNIPEETSFFLRRISSPPVKELMYVILPALFFIPFTVFLFKRLKSKPYIVSVISIVVLSGIFIERLVFILPAAGMHLNPKMLALESLIMMYLLIKTGCFE